MQCRPRESSVADFICFDCFFVLPGTEDCRRFFPVEADDSGFEILHFCCKGSSVIVVSAYLGVYAGGFFCDIGQANPIVKESPIFGSVEQAISHHSFVQDLPKLIALTGVVGAGLI